MANIKYFASHQRGEVMVLGINPDTGEQMDSLRFSDKKGSDADPVFLASIDMDKPDGQKRYEAVLKSKPFQKGFIFYVKSPEELEAELAAQEAGKKAEWLKNELKTGVLAINPAMDFGKLKELAKSIGIEPGKMPKPVLIRKIMTDLGLTETPEKQEDKPEARVIKGSVPERQQPQKKKGK